MFRGKRLALLVGSLVVILAATVYGLTRRQHSANPGPYAAAIERLHEINHEMREIHHSYKTQHDGEEAFPRWHDLLHEERDLLHGLPGALEEAVLTGASGAAFEGASEQDMPELDSPKVGRGR